MPRRAIRHTIKKVSRITAEIRGDILQLERPFLVARRVARAGTAGVPPGGIPPAREAETRAETSPRSRPPSQIRVAPVRPALESVKARTPAAVGPLGRAVTGA